MTNSNYDKVSQIASEHLGKVGGAGYKDTYDPTLLVEIPRTLNREGYGIEDSNLPFVGVDVWNAYEVSALTEKGLPVSGMLKIICPAESQFHIESKSIKLYLNSFNMTVLGKNTQDVVKEIEYRVSRDLSEKLQADVRAVMFTSNNPSFDVSLEDYSDITDLIDIESINFDKYHSDESTLISTAEEKTPVTYRLKSDLLRSNCRVTNQPDWGDIFIHIRSKLVPDIASLARYIVSHRKVNHFHEEIAEMIYVHLSKAYNPDELMVACLYTRRGGIDINPVRASSVLLIPNVFFSTDTRLAKTLRQ